MNNNRRILLVDDEEVITFGFSRVLKEPNVTVDTANTEYNALNLIQENNYDAAVIDVNLSGSIDLEGLEIIRKLKAAQNDCTIIVLTAYGEDIIREKAFDAGADYFYEKPMEPERIKEKLQSLHIYI